MSISTSTTTSTSTVTTLPPPPPLLEHFSPSSADQLCYVHCTLCDTVLAVTASHSLSLYSSYGDRSLWPLRQPPAGYHEWLAATTAGSQSVSFRSLFLLSFQAWSSVHAVRFGWQDDHKSNGSSNFPMNQNYPNDASATARGGFIDLPKPPVINRPPEKRQRVPSAYNRFIKEEIQRIKASNPEISHREAFSAAAKNWAHFPHIHFGLMGNQTVNKNSMRQQETGGGFMKESFISSANVGASPY
ncbi:hypothetical protein L2E82_06219 [Cichorium intybus]|uniref:Uncharacterized protein n=1 Tax=Cichorium intybus TaxID=13427 RepID=A0ACB9HBN0_CICIN|nr:hypothetical protein L2E82_06219 [Cichorium intybus]